MSIRTPEELAAMRAAGRIAAATLEAMRAAVAPGVSTAELDAIAHGVLARHGARSAPALVYRFPGVTCISLNEEVVHGIPKRRRIQPGDVVKLDVTIEKDGFMADTACTVVLGPDPVARRLAECARRAFEAALDAAKAGAPVNDVGTTVERVVRRDGFSVVEGLNGHGIGRTIHERPTVPNAYDPELIDRFEEGMVVTIEPLVAAGSGEAYLAADGWTVRTRDRSVAAHHEHTVMITRGRPVLLTALERAAA